jgi:hypothetical protein
MIHRLVDLRTLVQALPCDIGWSWQLWLPWWVEWLAC